MNSRSNAGAGGTARGRRMVRALPAGLLALLACGACAQCGELPGRWTGQVTRVSDGDTLWVRPESPDREPLKLRLLGLDAPERCQAGGREARDALEAWVLGRAVQVESRGLDAYGRVLGRVAQEGEAPADVGAWLVSEGHAWSDRWRGDAGPYGEQEAAARAAGRGLFADPAAVPPWRFRREHGPCE